MNDTREKQARALVAQKTNIINTIVNGDKVKTSTYASALVNLANDYNLRECSIDSILNVGFAIVQAGLNPNKLFGQAYAVPYTLKNGGKTAQLQIGYKGWISIGYRNGWRFKAVSVFKCDNFSIQFGGFEDVINFEPNYEARQDDDGEWTHKNLVGVIVYAKDNIGEIWTDFISFRKLEKLRLKSPNQNSKAKLGGVWSEWTEEMYKAKALKYVITKLPINEQIMSLAIEEDKPYRDEPKKDTKPQTLDLNTINAPKNDEKSNEILELEINETTGEIIQENETNAIKTITDFFIKQKVPTGKWRAFLKDKSNQECETLLQDPAGLDEIANQLRSDNV